MNVQKHEMNQNRCKCIKQQEKGGEEKQITRVKYNREKLTNSEQIPSCSLHLMNNITQNNDLHDIYIHKEHTISFYEIFLKSSTQLISSKQRRTQFVESILNQREQNLFLICTVAKAVKRKMNIIHLNLLQNKVT